MADQIVAEQITENLGNLNELKKLFESIKDGKKAQDKVTQKLYEDYKNKHDILERKRTIESDIDNKIPNNFEAEIIDIKMGYFLGKPIGFNVQDKDSTQFDDDIQTMRIITGEETIHTEVIKESSIKGLSFLLCYINNRTDESSFGFMKLPPEQVAEVNDSEGNITYYLRYLPKIIKGQDGKYKEVPAYELYSQAFIARYVDDNGLYEVSKEDNLLGDMPVVMYQNNAEQMGDFQKVRELIDEYDRAISDAANDLQEYTDAYFVIKGMEATDSTAFKEALAMRAFKVPQDGDVTFLTKETNNEEKKEHKDTLERNIYQFSKTPKFDDKFFAGNLTGVAIKYKLLGLEYRCTETEKYVKKALRQVMKLFCSFMAIKGRQYDYTAVDFVFERNIPANIVELLEAAQKQKGVVSDQTILEHHPWVSDPKAELAKVEKERTTIPLDNEALGGDTG